jgi:actin
MEEENEPIIIDIGSGTMKAGNASDDAPKHIIPMVMGKPKSKGALIGMDQKEWYIGQEALSKKAFLEFHAPVVAGRVQDIGHMEQIISHLMNDVMQRTLEEHKVMVTEVPLNDKAKREEFVDLM